jgi:hypothetical protein
MRTWGCAQYAEARTTKQVSKIYPWEIKVWGVDEKMLDFFKKKLGD